MVQPAGTGHSSTVVGKGSGPTSANEGPRQRAAGPSTRKTSSAASVRTPRPEGPANMLRFYTEDAPGLTIGPVPVLVMSLVFIFSVFALHIMGKIWRSAGSA
eukprot:comp19304_c1_seq1/m.22165 comp19304_c1_seq1/g.22165  ORF comp19304_c1_seq1/g.22165 comp19304_c1_seq1/m.22165 type:complete len:102 (-) comp19304_c1_seq1:135-440(-)